MADMHPCVLIGEVSILIAGKEPFSCIQHDKRVSRGFQCHPHTQQRFVQCADDLYIYHLLHEFIKRVVCVIRESVHCVKTAPPQ